MLYSEQMKQICEKLGVNPDECKDGLYSTLLQTICDACDGGGSGGGGDNFPIGDGNTHIWISLAEGRTSPVLGLAVNGTVTVDWGDGSEPDVLTGTSTTSLVQTPHRYSRTGDYVITWRVEGNAAFYGKSANSFLLTSEDGDKKVYAAAIRRIEVGANIAGISDAAFANCVGMREIVFTSQFNAKSIGASALYYCDSLGSISIPDGISLINGSAFAYDTGLCSVFFPASVTQLQTYAFNGCSGVAYFDFSQCTTVPTLGSTVVFQGISTACIFKIPAALYDEWIAATNWSALAAQNPFVGV